MQIKNNYIYIVFLCFIFSSCKSQQLPNKLNAETVIGVPKSYKSLSDNYSNKLILTAINTIYKKIKLVVNDSSFYFPDVYEMDSLNSEIKIKEKVLLFLNSNDSNQIAKKIKNWCDAYLLLDGFLSTNTNIYFEEFVLKEKRFTVIKHYFMTKEQNINSLSLSQSQMLYLDFTSFLSEYKINERVAILNNAIKSKNW